MGSPTTMNALVAEGVFVVFRHIGDNVWEAPFFTGCLTWEGEGTLPIAEMAVDAAKLWLSTAAKRRHGGNTARALASMITEAIKSGKWVAGYYSGPPGQELTVLKDGHAWLIVNSLGRIGAEVIGLVRQMAGEPKITHNDPSMDTCWGEWRGK